ncbi:uncharacterized protein G2W53_008793 [Senna tora]|uniref:Uncharacterized protein n=1 Tax=Senna tora TaxID=362788 RepID=A0A834WWS7_9FABA|nr:uncharacterized protein G2W53_008793 [Senna tora]
MGRRWEVDGFAWERTCVATCEGGGTNGMTQLLLLLYMFQGRKQIGFWRLGSFFLWFELGIEIEGLVLNSDTWQP